MLCLLQLEAGSCLNAYIYIYIYIRAQQIQSVLQAGTLSLLEVTCSSLEERLDCACVPTAASTAASHTYSHAYKKQDMNLVFTH